MFGPQREPLLCTQGLPFALRWVPVKCDVFTASRERSFPFCEASRVVRTSREYTRADWSRSSPTLLLASVVWAWKRQTKLRASRPPCMSTMCHFHLYLFLWLAPGNRKSRIKSVKVTNRRTILLLYVPQLSDMCNALPLSLLSADRFSALKFWI